MVLAAGLLALASLRLTASTPMCIVFTLWLLLLIVYYAQNLGHERAGEGVEGPVTTTVEVRPKIMMKEESRRANANHVDHVMNPYQMLKEVAVELVMGLESDDRGMDSQLDRSGRGHRRSRSMSASTDY